MNFTNPELTAFYRSGQMLPLLGHPIFSTSSLCDKSDGPTVVLIHGFPTSSWDWQSIMPMLSDSTHIEAIDMLGFGFSDKPNRRSYTIHQQADFHEAMLAHKNIKQVHLLVHDYGVSVAQELLARQQAGQTDIRYESCCFLNGGLFPETHKALLIQRLLLSPLGPLLNQLLAFDKFKRSFSSVFGTETQPSEAELLDFWEIINFNDGKHVFHNLITYMNDRRTHRTRWLNALKHSDVPIGLINGGHDPVSGAHLVNRYKELECRLDFLEELPAIGHYPQVEAPSDVASAYQSFLTQSLR